MISEIRKLTNFASIKTQLVAFLSVFAVFLAYINHNTQFILTTLIAITTAVIIESSLIYFKNKTFKITESSIITGLIIGYVLASNNIWWLFCFASVAAILSKLLLRINKKHIFNPAAFGIFCVIVFFHAGVQWIGTYLWYILIPFGIYFAYKTNKIEILLGYFLTSFLLIGYTALIHNISLISIFGYFSYFYIFIMIIEPKTSPVSLKGKWIFGLGVAIMVFVFNEIGIRFDAELSGLLFLNMLVPLLNKANP